MRSRRKLVAPLSDSISMRLNAYALSAAMADEAEAPCGMHSGQCHHSSLHWSYVIGAAIGTLGLAQPAEARIIYTAADVRIHDGFFSFHFNPDGPNDMGFHQRCSADGCSLFAFTNEPGNSILGESRDSYGYALALRGGATIGPEAPFLQNESQFMAATFPTHRGSWFVSGARYLGVVFQIEGKTHYGWMRLVNSSQRGATLIGYAYEDIPGKSIRAGQMKDLDDSQDEPESAAPDAAAPTFLLPVPTGGTAGSASLGELALGAAGL
jgi:hypothetical protein